MRRALTAALVIAALAPASIAAAYLPADAVHRVVREHMGEIRACYAQGLIRRPELAGQVVVRIVVGADGRVSGATITRSSLGDTVVEGCITSRIRSWQFPARETGVAFTINYPFVFSPG